MSWLAFLTAFFAFVACMCGMMALNED